ncbi:MAG: Bug family tripartite tricarboxylate transporter substrate binding protein [Beijerinckiaceae bacterium]
MPIRAAVKAAAAGAALMTCAAATNSLAWAQEGDAFYKGKTIDVYAGASPGSGYDGYARIVSRHIGRFIPGAPNVVVKNMPAASGLALANFLYNQAPRDGSVFAIIHNNLTVEPLIGNKNARFDAAKFGWVGSASKLNNVCVTWHTLPLRTIDDLRRREWVTGGTAARSSTVQQAHTFMVLGGAKLKVIPGYDSTTSMIMALERGEIEVACGIGFDSVKSSTSYYREGKIVPVMQLGYEKHPEMPNTPFIYDMLLSPDFKDIADFITKRLAIGRAFATPPEVPATRLKALREAFWAALQSPELMAEAKAQNMEIQPERGDAVQKLVEDLMQTRRDIIDVTDAVLENRYTPAKK